jgi:hypothetical protein
MFHSGKGFIAGAAVEFLGFLVVISLISLTSMSCLEAKADTIAAAPYLRTGSGARPLGMGGAFTVVTDDAASGIWNPAGLSKVNDFSLTAFTSKLSLDRKHNFIALAVGLGSGGLGLTFTNIGVDNITGYDASDKFTQNFDYSSNAIGLAYGLKSGKVNIGAGAKILTDRFGLETPESTTGFGGFDAGVIIDDLVEALSAGVVVKNLGGKISEATVPILIDVGFATRLLENNQVIFAFDLEQEVGGLEEDTTAVKGGVEYWIAKVVALRAGGQKTKFMRNLFAGFGVRAGGLQLDYAFRFGEDALIELGKPTHYASLTFNY